LPARTAWSPITLDTLTIRPYRAFIIGLAAARMVRNDPLGFTIQDPGRARPMMKARYGRIVNVSSVIGLHGGAGQANYGRF